MSDDPYSYLVWRGASVQQPCTYRWCERRIRAPPTVVVVHLQACRRSAYVAPVAVRRACVRRPQHRG
eukprot:scaffold357482_cov13-Prasinocladus_malaysianus.AAC.2